jgi:hypothetical protein
MPIPIGTQLGVHEILALLDKGGMGEVYRARDTKLKREVEYITAGNAYRVRKDHPMSDAT